jgi:hypothetical protein
LTGCMTCGDRKRGRAKHVTGREGKGKRARGQERRERCEARTEMCRTNGRRNEQAINQKIQECLDVLCETNKK